LEIASSGVIQGFRERAEHVRRQYGDGLPGVVQTDDAGDVNELAHQVKDDKQDVARDTEMQAASTHTRIDNSLSKDIAMNSLVPDVLSDATNGSDGLLEKGGDMEEQETAGEFDCMCSIFPMTVKTIEIGTSFFSKKIEEDFTKCVETCSEAAATATTKDNPHAFFCKVEDKALAWKKTTCKVMSGHQYDKLWQNRTGLSASQCAEKCKKEECNYLKTAHTYCRHVGT